MQIQTRCELLYPLAGGQVPGPICLYQSPLLCCEHFNGHCHSFIETNMFFGVYQVPVLLYFTLIGNGLYVTHQSVRVFSQHHQTPMPSGWSYRRQICIRKLEELTAYKRDLHLMGRLFPTICKCTYSFMEKKTKHNTTLEGNTPVMMGL